MSTHIRKPSNPSIVPRRTTRYLLDEDDPLSPSHNLNSSRATSSTLPPDSSITLKSVKPQGPSSVDDITIDASTAPLLMQQKDLSFVLDPGIYHSLSQVNVPPPFRCSTPTKSISSTNVSECLRQLDILLAECNFLAAASLSGDLLSSGSFVPTDSQTIFRILAIRYSCLELSGNVLLAAQEAKGLEDLNSSFYYERLPENDPLSDAQGGRSPPRHIMPFAMRLQVVRLQSIGFSDPRRAVSALYDLGLECRDNIISQTCSASDRQLWAFRLQEVGVRVVNALIEIGDFECARRALDVMRPVQEVKRSLWSFRMILLCLKMGLVEDAKLLAASDQLQDHERKVLGSLVAVANDDLDQAVHILSGEDDDQESGLLTLAKQNLAVALLYRGEIERARSVLAHLINQHESFQTLTMNLATMYELTSDRSKDKKLGLANKVAAEIETLKQARSFLNDDFKL